MIPYLPSKWQRDLHDDKHRFKVINVHRQAGKTTFSVLEVIKKAIEKPGLYWYVAPTYRDAYDIAWKKFNEYIPKELVKAKHETRMEIQLLNNSVIQLKGTEEHDKLRGRPIDGVVLDEFSIHQNQKELWLEVIEPSLLRTKGWAMFVGTPKGKNYFWLLAQEALNNASWLYRKLSVDDTGILSKEEVNEIRLRHDESTFRQEYMCDFLEGEGTVFRNLPYVVADCLSGKLLGRSYQMGVDLARKEDFTVITVVDRMSLHTVYQDRFNQIDWPLQKARIESTYRKYDCVKAVIDSTGVGDPIVQDLQREGLNIEPYQFTQMSKEKLIDHLSILIDKQKIKVPDLPELVKELKIFGFEKSENGRVKYSAPDGFHDDCVISLALAYWGITDAQRLTAGAAFGLHGSADTAYEFDFN